MRYVNTKRVHAGDKVGKDIISPNFGSILIKKNTILTDSLINSLARYEMDHLYVDDDLTSGIEIDEVIPIELKLLTTSAMKNINIEKTVDNAKKIAERILYTSNLSIDIYNNNESDVFGHSMSVMEIALSIARAMGYSSDRMADLAVASLLHDIGKLCVDKEVVKKNELSKMFENSFLNLSLSDYNEKMHSTYSYNLIANNTFVTSVIKQSVLMHHENYDGTGLLKVPQEKVHEFAKIIRVADVFINIATKEKNEYNVESMAEALEFMSFNSGRMFDPKIVETFLTKVPIYPEGMSIVLSDNTRAVVAKNNKQFPARPLLITEDARLVDLSDRDNLTLNIIGVDNGNEVVEKLRSEESRTR